MGNEVQHYFESVEIFMSLSGEGFTSMALSKGKCRAYFVLRLFIHLSVQLSNFTMKATASDVFHKI